MKGCTQQEYEGGKK